MNTLDKLKSSKFVNSTAFQTALKVGKAGVAIGILSLSGMASADTFYNDYTKAGVTAVSQAISANNSLSPLLKKSDHTIENQYRVEQGCKTGELRREIGGINNIQAVVVNNEAYQKNNQRSVARMNIKKDTSLVDSVTSNQKYLKSGKCGPENSSKKLKLKN